MELDATSDLILSHMLMMGRSWEGHARGRGQALDDSILVDLRSSGSSGDKFGLHVWPSKGPTGVEDAHLRE